MSNAGSIAAFSALTMAGASYSGAADQSQAIRTQGAIQSQQLSTNAQLARMQADDAKNRGEIEAQKRARQGAKDQGSQRANLAAQGIDVNTGSAADIQTDTGRAAATDVATIRSNAWRSAWGFNVEADNMQSQAQFEKIAAESRAGSTIMTGGLNAIGYGLNSYGKFKDFGAPDMKAPTPSSGLTKGGAAAMGKGMQKASY